MTRWSAATGTILLLVVMAMPAGAVTAAGGTFVDDDGSVHESAIEAIGTAGITHGCDPVGDLFCPARAVTRAEMAAFLIRSLGEPPVAAPSATFSDVGPDDWYFGAVERLAALEISVGYGDGTYRPDDFVTRGEMAAFLVRTLGEADAESATGVFADVPASVFYAGAAERLFELDITRGCAEEPLRFCPTVAVTRAEMASFLTRAFDLPQEPVPPRPSLAGVSLRAVAVADGLDQPVFATSPAGDDRLFIVEKGGRVVVVVDGSIRPQPFLDISGLVSTAGERGLLGMAFHPDHAVNGRFFVHYTDGSGANRVVEYGLSDDPDVADTASARPLLTVGQPASNHNGGMIEFGPDGRLYVGIGDGGGARDQYGHGQNPSTPLATITALDVDSGATTLFAYGLRNPWRFSWDGDRVFVADVGQNSREEIDVVSRHQAGANLGWSAMEGSVCFVADCSQFVAPVIEYTHAEGCSVTGGYVYRGPSVAAAVGHYFYGDFCSGTVWSFRYTGAASEQRVWPSLATDGLVSFGVDGDGELHLVSIHGTVWRIEAG